MTKRILIVLVVLLAACGGAAESPTTEAPDATTTTEEPEETTTTTSASEEEGEEEAGEEGTNNTVDLADMPQECIDAFVGFLQAIEPVVTDFDFDSASLDDLEAMGTELEAVGEAQAAEMESLNCPDASGTDEEAFAQMIEIAEREAPGTVPYFRWIESFAGSLGEGGTSSGDCETDIEALEALISENESMGDLTMAEGTQFGVLAAAIGAECSPERTQEFFSQPEVAAFMGEGG
jgi:hypothetical protein